MLDRLSEWLSNLSLVSLASIVLPALIGSTQKAIDIDVWFGFLSAVLSLWWSCDWLVFLKGGKIWKLQDFKCVLPDYRNSFTLCCYWVLGRCASGKQKTEINYPLVRMFIRIEGEFSFL